MDFFALLHNFSDTDIWRWKDFMNIKCSCKTTSFDFTPFFSFYHPPIISIELWEENRETLDMARYFISIKQILISMKQLHKYIQTLTTAIWFLLSICFANPIYPEAILCVFRLNKSFDNHPCSLAQLIHKAASNNFHM